MISLAIQNSIFENSHALLQLFSINILPLTVFVVWLDKYLF